MEINSSSSTPSDIQPTPVQNSGFSRPKANLTVPAAPMKQTPAAKLTAMTRQYLALVNAGIRDNANKKKAAELLLEIVRHVLITHDHQVFDTFLGFMMKNRSTMLSTRTVMNGLLNYIDGQKAVQIIQLYVIFEALVESKMNGRPYPINVNHVRDLFHNKDLVDWLNTQKKV